MALRINPFPELFEDSDGGLESCAVHNIWQGGYYAAVSDILTILDEAAITNQSIASIILRIDVDITTRDKKGRKVY